MKQNKQLRSDCPISFSLDMFGDKWSLLIIRDMVFADKKTFNDFLLSDEGIARNILAARLKLLAERDILRKDPHPTDGRKDIYTLTNKGRDLIPILHYLAIWGEKHEPRTRTKRLDPNGMLLKHRNY